MKLQIKDAGAWRNVISFHSNHEQSVCRHSSELLSLAGPGVAMRIVNENGIVELYCQAPDFAWRGAPT